MQNHTRSITKKHLLPLLSLIVILSASSIPVFAADTTTFNSFRSGRKIQHDGFLMEWGIQTAQPWDSAGSWVWDAMATSEGIAGYVRSKNVPACRDWTITGMSTVNNKLREIHLPPDSVFPGDELRLNRQEYDDGGRVIIEWLFPLKNAITDKSTPLTLMLTGKSACGDTLPVLQLAFTAPFVKKSGTMKMTGQGILIVILAIMYLTMQRKIRCQTQRKESPRQ